jgi:hypothetical protein
MRCPRCGSTEFDHRGDGEGREWFTCPRCGFSAAKGPDESDRIEASIVVTVDQPSHLPGAIELAIEALPPEDSTYPNEFAVQGVYQSAEVAIRIGPQRKHDPHDLANAVELLSDPMGYGETDRFCQWCGTAEEDPTNPEHYPHDPDCRWLAWAQWFHPELVPQGGPHDSDDGDGAAG